MNGNSNHLSFGYYGVKVIMVGGRGGRGKTKSPSMNIEKNRKSIGIITAKVDAAEVWEVDSNVNFSLRYDVEYVFR